MPRIVFRTEDSAELIQLLTECKGFKNSEGVKFGDTFYGSGELGLDTFNIQRHAGILSGEILLASRQPGNPHPVDDLETAEGFPRIAELISVSEPLPAIDTPEPPEMESEPVVPEEEDDDDILGDMDSDPA